MEVIRSRNVRNYAIPVAAHDVYIRTALYKVVLKMDFRGRCENTSIYSIRVLSGSNVVRSTRRGAVRAGGIFIRGFKIDKVMLRHHRQR